MKPQHALLLAAGTAAAGTLLLAARRPPPPRIWSESAVVVIAEELSTLPDNAPSAVALEVAFRRALGDLAPMYIQRIALPGELPPRRPGTATWVGPGPRVTRRAQANPNGFVTTTAWLVTWPPDTLTRDEHRVRTERLVAAVTRSLDQIPRAHWLSVLAVPYAPSLHGLTSFWVEGDARNTQTRDLPIQGVTENPVNPNTVAIFFRSSRLCCAGATVVFTGIVGWSLYQATRLAVTLFPGDTRLHRTVHAVERLTGERPTGERPTPTLSPEGYPYTPLR